MKGCPLPSAPLGTLRDLIASVGLEDAAKKLGLPTTTCARVAAGARVATVTRAAVIAAVARL